MALFSKKIKRFVDGRKSVFYTLKENIFSSDKTIWFHCASLGEFEQGVPIMEEIRKLKPDHKFVVSFFSPSGYEVKKNTTLADVVIYLPMDTPGNAKRFIAAVHPNLVFFVKYEFWPNYLLELNRNKITTLLISGVFQKKQIFFKSYGNFMRQALNAFDHFFVQDENSSNLLNDIGFQNNSISGDTRFDRVSHQLKKDNSLKFAEEFIGNSLCIVCGSTWKEDEEVLLEYINSASDRVKFIIAPHKIDPQHINNFKKLIEKKTILHSELDEVNISEYNVLIIDCIGLLTKLYHYADIAFVGGAMGSTGLHNILEPAAFGVPIVIGKNYSGFPEAATLQSLGGLFTVKNATDIVEIFTKLVDDNNLRKKTGTISSNFVYQNLGATQKIMNYIIKHSI